MLFTPNCECDLAQFNYDQLSMSRTSSPPLSDCGSSSSGYSVHDKGFKRIDGQFRKRNSFICNICFKVFSRPSTLKTHTNSHTGKRPHRCPNSGCTGAFSVRSNMLRHCRICPFSLGK